jgi:hypothetical protein
MDFSYGETVQVLTAGTTTDPYSGEPAEDWDTATSADVTGVAVEPRPSGEPLQDARNQVTSGFTLYMPQGAAITSKNRVSVRGATYDVLGEPADWRSPFTGWEPGIVVQVERSEG